jgi:hypothetical protein
MVALVVGVNANQTVGAEKDAQDGDGSPGSFVEL